MVVTKNTSHKQFTLNDIGAHKTFTCSAIFVDMVVQTDRGVI